MKRLDYLSPYLFKWELLEVILEGKSALDSSFFISPLGRDNGIDDFLKEYGLDPGDPVTQAELFGNFQEALQFIKKYFLKSGNSNALDMNIPPSFYQMTSVKEVIRMATGNNTKVNQEEVLWAEIILKVMHTILHVDKDLKSNYFNIIQTQIFDRFYRFLHRDKKENLFLGKRGENALPIVGFETKSRKSRDSVIIKLLHKEENIAEELFDRIGIRIITKNRFDIIRAISFLVGKFIILPHNIKPSRSINTIVDIVNFKKKHHQLIRTAIREEWDEKTFLETVEKEIKSYAIEDKNRLNLHSSDSYRSIQFTYRQLIKYKKPFWKEFNELKALIQENTSDLAEKIRSLDTSSVDKEVRFFFPYEVQIVDEETHQQNSLGDASHSEYKKSQIQSVIKRIFGPLIAYKRSIFNRRSRSHPTPVFPAYP